MAESRRRAGSRRGAVSDGLREAIADEAGQLAAKGSPAAVVRAVGDFYAQLDFELEAVSQVRLAAIRDLRSQGQTYEEIADATGLSKPRVAQLARTAGAGGKARHGGGRKTRKSQR